MGYTKIAFESLSSFSFSDPIGVPRSASAALRRVRSGRGKTTVYNVDMQAGFYYWFTPTWKAALSYRLDAFMSPLRTFPSAREHRGGDRPLLPWTQADAHRQDLMRVKYNAGDDLHAVGRA